MRKRRNSGITLLELLAYSALFILAATATMRALAESRELQGRARDKVDLLLITQTEMDRLRHMPVGELEEGKVVYTKDLWPAGTQLAVEIKKHDDATWLVDLQATRESVEGKPSARLTTILPREEP